MTGINQTLHGPVLPLLAGMLLGVGCGDACGKNRCGSDQDCLPPRVCTQGGECGFTWESSSTGTAQPGQDDDGGIQEACETRERVVLAIQTDNDASVAPVLVYKLVDAHAQRVTPPGYLPSQSAVTRPEPLEPTAPILVRVRHKKIWVGDSYGFYALDSATLRPTDVRTGERELPADHPNALAVETTELIWTDATTLKFYNLTKALEGAGAYRQTLGEILRFIPNSTGVFMLLGQQSFRVLYWVAPMAPEQITYVNSADRLGDYGSGIPRAAGIDPNSRQLFVATRQGLTLTTSPRFWELLPPDHDWQRPNLEQQPEDRVHQAVSRNNTVLAAGSTFVAVLDANALPPATRRFRQWEPTPPSVGVALGCRHAVVVYPNTVLWLNLETLDTVATLNVEHPVKDVTMVDKDELSITGDL